MWDNFKGPETMLACCSNGGASRVGCIGSSLLSQNVLGQRTHEYFLWISWETEPGVILDPV